MACGKHLGWVVFQNVILNFKVYPGVGDLTDLFTIQLTGQSPNRVLLQDLPWDQTKEYIFLQCPVCLSFQMYSK